MMTALSNARLDHLERAAKTRAPPLTAVLVIPNIIEFATNDDYLGLTLYPRQATLLKVICCAADLLTDFDRAVIEEWGSGFTFGAAERDSLRYQGATGIVPDVLDRMTWCREHHRRWFREVVMVVGRRGGKGHLGAIVGAYTVWCLLAVHDPQQHHESRKPNSFKCVRVRR